MLSLRPPLLGVLVLTALTAGSLAVWRAWSTQPGTAAAPRLGLDAPAQTPRASITQSSFEPIVPALSGYEPLALRLRDERDWHYRVFAADARFPAISEDGTTVIELFQDREDFSDAPSTTLVAWSRSGTRTAVFTLFGQTGMEERILRSANAWLATTRWKRLDGEAAIETSEDGERATITTRTGATLRFDISTGQLTRRGRAVAGAGFPSPGTSSMEVGGGGCGDIRGIHRAFGDEHVVVLIPSVNLGGDSCAGERPADLAIAIALD